MCGYMHIVTEPLLTSYTVLNVHPADLTILTGSEDERIHLGCIDREEAERITKETDQGPIVVQSRAFSVDHYVKNLDEKGLREYVVDLQGKMKTYCDGPAYLKELELLATDLVVTENKRLFLDGEELPYGGIQL